VTATAAPTRAGRTTLRAWGTSLLALVVAGAGLFALASSSTTTSLLRMAVAAGVLSVFVSAAGVLVTPAEGRTRLRCLAWAGLPLVVGAATAFLVAGDAGPVGALEALLPWLVGPVAAAFLGSRLPALRLPTRR
jgi:hypothetical protein